MKTMISPWTLAMVALLAAQTVVGFRMFDVLRASRQIKDSRRDIMAPADVLVHVVLEELDVNDDQQVTFREIGEYFALLLDKESGRPLFEEAEGYIITMATILDADQSEIVELDELQRAANILVNNAGTVEVGNFIDWQANIGLRTGRLDQVVKAGEMAGDFLAALDTDNDGLVSTEEREPLVKSQRFYGFRTGIPIAMDNVDVNNDGYLDHSETSQFLTAEAESDPWFSIFPLFYVYARTWKLAGADVAKKWLNPWRGF